MSQTDVEKRADERKKRLIKYFIEAPDPRDLVVAAAFLTAAACLTAGAWAILHFLSLRIAADPLFVLAFFAATTGIDKALRYRRQYDKSHPRPADNEMDLLLGDEITKAQSTALENLEITTDDLELTGEWDPLAELEARTPRHDLTRRRPLVVFSPYDEVRDEVRAEVGIDGLWRFSAYWVMVICPTHFSLGIYLCTIDILTGALGHESTYEYHYDDVVAILTNTVGEEKNPRQLADGKVHFARSIRRELQIVASSGDGPKIPVMIPVNGASNEASAEPPEFENVIASVRRLLRDRKNNAHLERV